MRPRRPNALSARLAGALGEQLDAIRDRWSARSTDRRRLRSGVHGAEVPGR